MKGKIIKGIAGFYYVHDGVGSIYQCRARGLFRKNSVKPLVGDDVEFTEVTDTDVEKAGNIDRILPRKSRLLRPAAANIDQALVIFAAKNPEPNLNLLDRFLVMMAIQDVPVVIGISKADLIGPEERERIAAIYRSSGCPVHFLSRVREEGLPELMTVLRGKTTVLAGPSGVGKSTLTNWLQPDAGMEVGEISRKLGRGKNTTRHSEIFFVCADTFICDTPGFSSIEITGTDERELKAYFPEFAPYAPSCRFRECVHIGERDCAVQNAVSQGIIPVSRYENYRQIYQELKERRKY
ncbi:ribosome small subunit-dependent GTPase A [Clostridium vitabionis]|uniref:ribosome small subunit-dependent GTPase A n=1 Tax=Clostridium vitabionis TaxID=2784388 RepID=UPI00188D05F0|nr:ribosome small subunit-dependent GTPase A [Clostridium vitabionis]